MFLLYHLLLLTQVIKLILAGDNVTIIIVIYTEKDVDVGFVVIMNTHETSTDKGRFITIRHLKEVSYSPK